MRGSVLAKAYAAIVRPRDELSLKEATELLRIAFGEETLAQKRARAGREGGKRSVDVRRSELGTAQPRSTVRSEPEADAEAPPEANSKQNESASVLDAPPSSSPSHSPSDSLPEIPKESAVVAKEPVPVARAANVPGTTTPTDFESAMRETIQTRCSLALADRTFAREARVNDWPEVVEILATWYRLKQLPGTPRLRPHGTDTDVDAVLTVLAMGYEPSEVERILAHLAKHSKFRDKMLLRAVLSVESAQIALGEMPSPRRPSAPDFQRPATREPKLDPAEERELMGKMAAAIGVKLPQRSAPVVRLEPPRTAAELDAALEQLPPQRVAEGAE